MYDEFERAVTGKPKKGIPAFGWILIVLAFLFMFGVVGVGLAANHIAHKVRHEFSHEMSSDLAADLAEMQEEIAQELEGMDTDVAAEVEAALREVEAELQAEFGDDAPSLTAGLLTRMEPRLHRIMGKPAMSLAILQDLGSKDYSEKALRDVLEGSLQIRTEDGELTADLWSGDDGGSLVIQGTDGERISIDLVRGDEGGSLSIQSEDGALEFGAGSEAADLPRWVPTPRWMPDHPAPVFSMASEDGSMGAVSWDTDRSPDAVLDYYRDILADAGYSLREDHSTSHRGKMEGGFWAENHSDDRVVFVAASQEEGVTKVLLGYGEEMN